jgi:two-component system chemotaxis family response regulator WspR
MIIDSAEAPLSPIVEESITVLLVDDQPIIGEAVRRALLREPDVQFRYCANPMEAIAVARETKPTVILQDLVMPNVNGLELVRQYRADPVTSGIPIIVLSTKEEPLVKSDAFKMGANDYLVKLPDQIELVARIRYHSKAYLLQLQRDSAYRALHESQQRLMETNRELERLTSVDGLTGISNRRYFNEYIEREWNRAMRSQIPLSILLIDVDHFKQYNDTYGHIAGDEVLRKVAQTMSQACRRSADLAARYGGEEFVVTFPETPATDIRHLGERLCEAVEALQIPHSASSAGKYVTISVGAATTIPQMGEAVVSLIDAADKALYEAKKSGRNRIVIHDRGASSPALVTSNRG